MLTAIALLAAATVSPGSPGQCNHHAHLKTQPAAVLPSSLRAKYPHGKTVRMLLEVGANGTVTGAGIWGAKPDPQLAALASSTAMRMHFVPATVNCKPIADRFFYDLSFK